MRYQGGKSRIAGQIAAKIRELHPTATEIWEPFCGGGAVTLALAKVGFHVHASDNHEDLILMWQALMRGETAPFADVAREEHAALKHAAPSARRAFVRFGASFGGDFNGGFGIDKKNGEGHQPWQEAQRFCQKLQKHRALSFALCDYRAIPSDVLVYADKPYEGTYDYQGRAFDHDAFWQWVRQRSGATFVSELTGPEDVKIVWNRLYKSQNISNVALTEGRVKERRECLFYKPATIPSHEPVDAAGVPRHDAAAHHADHGLPEHEQPAAGLPAQRAEGEPAAAGAGGAVDARE